MTSSLTDWPVARLAPTTEIDAPSGTYTYGDPDGLLFLYLDSHGFEFWLEASPDAPSSLINGVLDRLVHPLGFELLSEDECEPEVTSYGWTRIHLAPVSPVADIAAAPIRRLPAARTAELDGDEEPVA